MSVFSQILIFQIVSFFKIGSPVFIQRRLEDGSNKHYTYEDTVAGNLLEETLRHKMQVAGLPDDRTLKISFATEYPKKKIKTIYYNGIGNRTSWCPVRIQGSRKLKYLHGRPGLEIVPEPVLDRFIEYGLLYSKI